MSYYRGDYYRGDYYRGDPYIGTFFRGAASLVKPLITTVAKRVGAAGRALAGMRPVQQAARVARDVALPTAVAVATTRTTQAVLPGAGPEAGAPINYPEAGAAGVPMMTGMGVKGMCPPGYHPNKSDSIKGPKGSYCVRNRRMNPLNPRALRRALRRSEDFEGIAKRTVNALRSGPRKFKKVSTMSR
jgi:hypothetical protein